MGCIFSSTILYKYSRTILLASVLHASHWLKFYVQFQSSKEIYFINKFNTCTLDHNWRSLSKAWILTELWPLGTWKIPGNSFACNINL